MIKLGVLQIIDSLNTGGAEVLAVNIANALSKESINSHLCTTRAEGNLITNLNADVGYIYLKKNKILDYKAIIKLKNYVIKNNISIIHAHSSSYFTAFCLKIFYNNLYIIWHDHYGITQDLSKRSLFPIKFISKYFYAILSVNENLKKWSLDNLKCKRVLFLNNFATFNNFDKITFLKKEESKKIVHVAAFRAQKDHENLLHAYEKFYNKNKNWTLHLIGSINNNLYYEKIIKLIKNKGLEKSVFIYGACLDIKNILNQADIGVLSSKSEGLPISLLEYGLAKLPVIVTNVGECSKVVENGISGYVVAPENNIELSLKLDILANSELLRTSFGIRHHKKVTSKYSRSYFLKQLLNIYKL
ncbi:glycosyltransferase [uncultured Polaribacter sp.]|uniref:glycosyltransferase n=1 Tax=uncultured Polaribacter sp. TaxID=174711 RepID=UPI00261BD3FB|nr:glycosyltransferase [uncultured Polaribacter sp.]